MSDPTNPNVEGFEYPDDDIDPDELVTNDAAGGETVFDNGNYAGPEGSEPLEEAPYEAPNDLSDEPIDLDDAE